MPFSPKKRTREPLTQEALLEYAVRSLGRSMRSVAGLRRLMQSRVEPGESGAAKMDAVLDKLKELGYLNDEAFAASYTHLRQENERYGRRRVQQGLALKGVPAPVADAALDAAYAEVDEEKLARAHLERKRVKQPVDQKQTARVIRQLIHGGFSMPVIYRILRNWDLPDEALEGLDAVADDASALDD